MLHTVHARPCRHHPRSRRQVCLQCLQRQYAFSALMRDKCSRGWPALSVPSVPGRRSQHKFSFGPWSGQVQLQRFSPIMRPGCSCVPVSSVAELRIPSGHYTLLIPNLLTHCIWCSKVGSSSASSSRCRTHFICIKPSRIAQACIRCAEESVLPVAFLKVCGPLPTCFLHAHVEGLCWDCSSVPGSLDPLRVHVVCLGPTLCALSGTHVVFTCIRRVYLSR